MIWLISLVAFLMAFGSLLAMAETSISRMNRIRAMALEEEGRRNASLLVRIESDPPQYLNSIYLWVMFAQNGSAILVAIVSQHYLGNIWVTVISVLFTLAYFVVVEAMSKTFGILHSDRVALGLAPVVYGLSRILALPTRALISLANVLLPGKGLEQGPFVTEEEIRSMAQVGHEEGAIEQEEKEMIHSIFEFGDTIVREVMVPRPDMVAAPSGSSIKDVLSMIMHEGHSRIPVYTENLDSIVGIVYAKDILKYLTEGKLEVPLEGLMRSAYVIPETKKVNDLLRELRKRKIHMAIVVDEYGTTVGLVTIEDLLEEIVGEIFDEYDLEEIMIEQIDENTIRVDARVGIDELTELLGITFPEFEGDTIGGFIFSLLGRIPNEGEKVPFENLLFTIEKVGGRRIRKILIARQEEAKIENA